MKKQSESFLYFLISIALILLISVGMLVYYFWWLPIDQPTKPVGILAPLSKGEHWDVEERGKEILKHLKRYPLEGTENWNIYSNPDANFTFKYPKGWEIVLDETYETLSGIKGAHSVALHKINGSDDDWIVINVRQFSSEEASIYLQIDGNFIATPSRNLEVVDIFYKLVKTFKTKR
jgi:hypothetical protein